MTFHCDYCGSYIDISEVSPWEHDCPHCGADLMNEENTQRLEQAVKELVRIWKELYGGKMCRCAIIPIEELKKEIS